MDDPRKAIVKRTLTLGAMEFAGALLIVFSLTEQNKLLMVAGAALIVLAIVVFTVGVVTDARRRNATFRAKKTPFSTGGVSPSAPRMQPTPPEKPRFTAFDDGKKRH